MARQEASGSGPPQPVAKRQRMGPKECLQYSGTSAGAAALTNPHSVQKAKPDPRQNLMPFQRGRSQSGSGFIPSNQPGYSGSSQGSNNVRQYVSPSKGQPVRASGEQVYDRSGYTCIGLGSPYKKVFNQRRGHPRSASYPQSKQSSHTRGSQTNNWKQGADSLTGTGNHVNGRPTSSRELFSTPVTISQFTKRRTDDPGKSKKSPTDSHPRDLKTPSSVSKDYNYGIKSEPYSPGEAGSSKGGSGVWSPHSTSGIPSSSWTKSPHQGNQFRKSGDSNASTSIGSQFSKRYSAPSAVSPVASSQFSRKQTAGSSSKSPISSGSGALKISSPSKDSKFSTNSVTTSPKHFGSSKGRGHVRGTLRTHEPASRENKAPPTRNDSSSTWGTRTSSSQGCQFRKFNNMKTASSAGGSQLMKQSSKNGSSPQGSQFVKHRDSDTTTDSRGRKETHREGLVDVISPHASQGASSRNGSPPQGSQFVRHKDFDSTTTSQSRSSTSQQGFVRNIPPCALKTANSAPLHGAAQTRSSSLSLVSPGKSFPKESTNKQFSPSKSPKKQALLTKYMGTTPTKSVNGEVSSQEEKPSVKRDLSRVWHSSGTDRQSKSFQPSHKGMAKKSTVETNSTLLRFKPKNRSSISASSSTSAIPAASPKKGGGTAIVIRDSNSTVSDIIPKEREPLSSQDSTGGCDLSSLSVLSQPDSVAESLEAFENDSVEDLLDEYDMTEDGTFIASQPSVASDATPDNIPEDVEDDPIENALKDYVIEQDGRVVHSQSSTTSQESSSGDPEGMVRRVKVEEEDEETRSTSSDESVALFLRMLRSDEDSTVDSDADTDDTECHLLSYNSIVDGPRTDAKKTSERSRLSDVPCSPEHGPSTSASVSALPSTSGSRPTEMNGVNYEDMIDDEEIPEELLEQLEAGHVIDQVPLKGRTFGLVGDERDGEMEDEEERDFFEALPVEVLENIFCRLPILYLMQSCARVCQRWRDIITDASFIPWRKSYTQCKRGTGQWVSPLAESSLESCLLDLIRYLSTVTRIPGESTTRDLQQHPKYGFAKDMIAENLPDLIKDGIPHPWSVIAALVILAETVADVKDTMTCLLHPRASNSPMAVTEVLYCIATLLLSLQRQHNLCRRLHYRVFYALFLYENDVSPSPIALIGNTPEKPRHVANGRASFPLTQEQRRIVNHKLDMNNMNEVIKVVAFAGTGKTTTLIKFAEANIYLHLLYVAFNKSVQMEASRTFPGNTECRTSHSLAWAKLKRTYGNKLSHYELSPHDISDLLPERQKPQKSSLQWALYARLVGDTLKAYMASADPIITTRHVPEEYSTATTPHTPLIHEDRMRLLRDAEYLWGRMTDERDREAKITHDGYFKVYQLSKPVISDIHCLLIDEAQDLTPAQQDVFLNQLVPKILVGDPNQQIYSFRGANNAMSAIQADAVFHLTQSFRFGSEIAYMANCILDVFKDMTEQTVIGKDEDGTLRGEHIGQLAIICRGNTTIFKEAVRLVTTTPQGVPLRLGFTAAGGFNFDKLMDLYKMSSGAKIESIRNEFFRKMQSFASLTAYATNAQDNELLGLINIVKLYNHNIPDYVARIKAKTVKKLDNATIVLTTAHKSKGLEFDTVQLTEDFLMFGPTVVQTEDGIMITENVRISEDEKNLIYVAATRARKSLFLNQGLKKCLQKASDPLKFPLSTKLFLDGNATLEERRCLDCGQLITTQQRVTMVKVWSIKMGSSARNTQQETHPANNGGYICSGCAHHHMRGFEKIFLGDRNAPRVAEMEVDMLMGQ